MQNLEAFRQLISSPRNIVITTHPKPDADALGSSLGLAGYLKKKNHRVQVITPTDYPRFLHWMPGNEEVIVFNEGNEARSAAAIQGADVIFCLDFSVLSRIETLGGIIKNAPGVKVMIDHHLAPEHFADFEFWDTGAAATCQLIFELIEALGELSYLDPSIGECIYAGIMTDTASFRHPNTTKKVHLISAELIELGVQTNKVQRLVYDNQTEERLRFLGYALSEKLVVLRQYRTAYFAVSTEELHRFQSQTGDTEGLVNYGLSIEGIVMAVLMTEREGSVRLSLRSVGDFSVNDFARKHFAGGGHKNAAGGTSYLSLEETVQKFIQLLPQYKDQLS